VKFANLHCKQFFYLHAEKYPRSHALKRAEKLAVHGATSNAIAATKANPAKGLSRKLRLCP
jgi:hypothetical protein